MPGGRRRAIGSGPRLRRRRFRRKYTRRVGAIPPEQEDRFAEHRGAQRGDRARTASALDQPDQAHRSLAALRHRRPAKVRGDRQRLRAERLVAPKLDRHGRPSAKHRARRRIDRCAARTVPVERLEIEAACSQPEDPAPDRARHDTPPLRDAGLRSAAQDHFADRIEDDLDADDPARQRIPGQDSLAVPAALAARQRHLQRHVVHAGLELTLDAAASQPEVTAAARGASTAGQDLVASVLDDRRVLATFEIEYEDHVLMTAPG